MARMHRTQIYLDDEQTAALDRLAQCRGTTRSQLLRIAAQRFLNQEAPEDEDPLFGIFGLGSSAEPGCGSEDHDRILVESELRRWH